MSHATFEIFSKTTYLKLMRPHSQPKLSPVPCSNIISKSNLQEISFGDDIITQHYNVKITINSGVMTYSSFLKESYTLLHRF